MNISLFLVIGLLTVLGNGIPFPEAEAPKEEATTSEASAADNGPIATTEGTESDGKSAQSKGTTPSQDETTDDTDVKEESGESEVTTPSQAAITTAAQETENASTNAPQGEQEAEDEE